MCDARRTGSLVLRGATGRTVILYLRDGDVAAAFDQDEDLLGKCLVKTGALTWKELDEFTKFFQPIPATFAKVLVDQRKVDAEAVRKARNFAIRELVFEALSWDRAASEFYDELPVPQLVRAGLPPDGPGLSTKPLLMMAVTQLDEWALIRVVVPSDGDVPVPVGSDAGGALLELIDGTRSVAEVVARAAVGRFAALEQLKALVETGAVRLRDVDELKSLAEGLRDEVDNRDKRIALFQRAEELGLDDDAVCLWLADAYEARGDRVEASRRLLAVARKQPRSEDALGIMRRALRLRPDDGSLQRELIQRLIDQGRSEDAAMQVETYVAWLRKRGEPIQTLKAARSVLEQLDEFEEMLVLQAELSAEAGNRAQAVRLYGRIARIRLDSDLADEFSLDERVDVLERILALEPSELDTRWRLVQLLSPTRTEQAAAELQEFIAHGRGGDDPRLAEAYELLQELDPTLSLTGARAEACLDAGDKDGAEALLRAALADGAAAPDEAVVDACERLFSVARTPESHDLLATALLESGQLKRGLAELGLLGADHARGGDDEAALAAYAKALEYDPFDWGTRSALAEVLLELGSPSEWLDNLRALVDIARIRGDGDTSRATLGVYVQEAPEDVAARMRWVQELVACKDESALEHLLEFAVDHAAQSNKGLVAWAIEQAKTLDAPPEWFEGLEA
jgi:tetratricopeptide (TPR) repeat protein